MSETWTSLLAALVGAIVGGAASLAGTVLVNRMQMVANARMRMYDGLLPKVQDALEDFMTRRIPIGDAEHQMSEAVLAVRRASAIAGQRERKLALRLEDAWSQIIRKPGDAYRDDAQYLDWREKRAGDIRRAISGSSS